MALEGSWTIIVKNCCRTMNGIFLLVLVIISLSSAHWLCDLASFPCHEEDGTEKYLSKNHGTWITKVDVTNELTEFLCALRCLQKRGSILLYLEGKNDLIKDLIIILVWVLHIWSVRMPSMRIDWMKKTKLKCWSSRIFNPWYYAFSI